MTPNRVRDLVGLAGAARCAKLERPGTILAFVRGALVHGPREPDELDRLLEAAGILDSAWHDAILWAHPPVADHGGSPPPVVVGAPARRSVRNAFLARHGVRVPR